MSLRKRTILIIGALVILLLVCIYSLSQILFLESYLKLERQDTEKGTQRIVFAFVNKLNNLDTFVHDWSAWDDTYKYANDPNPGYIKSNVTDSTFVSSGNNFLIITNNKGQIVFKKAVDLEIGKEMPFPDEIANHFTDQKQIVTYKDLSSNHVGVLQYGKSAVMFAARPILTSEEKGPIAGTFAIGKILDQADTAKLASITHDSLMMYYFDNDVLPEDVIRAKQRLQSDTIFTQILNDDFIAGYVLVRDIYQKPSLIFKIEIPRSIYKQGINVINIGMLAFLITGLIFGIVVLLVLEKFILSRMTRLAKDAERIGDTADFTGRVSVDGNDEISALKNSINKMLNNLQDALNQVRTLRGLLPMCSHCRKIRNDGGYWQQLEKFVGEHSTVEFSHSLCPQCVKELYPELADKVLKTMAKDNK